MFATMNFLDAFSTIIYIQFFSWIYLIFFHGRRFLSKDNFFWSSNIVFEQRISDKKNKFKISSQKKICLFIPARNEEKFIEKTLTSLINQKLNNLFVLIINDNSTDLTVSKAKNIFEKKKFKNYKILNGKKLPKGWSGKVWALYQGIESVKKKYDYFLFIDSDIVISKGLINSAVKYLESKNLLMLSLMAKLKCKTIWEKLLIPSFIFFFQKLYPFNLVNSNFSNLAAAAGGFILCDANLFKKENLYKKIKNKIIDDCNLAKLIKKKGSIWLGLTDLVRSQRSYERLSEIWKMVSRTAFEQLKNSILLLFFSIIGLLIIYIVPFLNLFIFNHYDNTLLYYLNFINITMIIFVIVPTIKFYNLPPHYYFSVPFSALIYTLMTVNSAYNFYFKKGNVWKGRKY